MNGDEIRATRFVRGRQGYDASEVDGLLGRVAAELDAGRPAGPLIENATFRNRGRRRYDIDSVDWFLDQLLLPPGRSELARLGADPWRDLPVAQVTRDGVSAPAPQPGDRRDYFAEECANLWRDFGQQPGTCLRWEPMRSSGQPRRWERELRTADQQTVASARTRSWTSRWPQSFTFSVGGRSFTVTTPKIPARSTTDSWPPDIAELAARSWRDQTGHYAAGTVKNRAQRAEARGVRELVDETGTPILHFSGSNFNCRACARVTFPDQRWFRFLVRGTKRANAIMTAVDQAGNKVARYRDPGQRFHPGETVEIAVHPDQKLTDELILAIAISPLWPAAYFARPH